MAALAGNASLTSGLRCYIGDGAFSKCYKSKVSHLTLVRCSGDGGKPKEGFQNGSMRAIAAGLCTAFIVSTASPAFCASSISVKLPPISSNPNRCKQAYVGNTIGQANGVADKQLDLRFCDFTNNKENLKGKTLSSALMADANFDGADMTEVIMTKAYAMGASFKGTNFTNAILDRVVFDKADLRGVRFKNTVLSGSTFEGANLQDASFEDALLGYVDIQKLCRNSTLPEESRIDLGCKN